MTPEPVVPAPAPSEPERNVWPSVVTLLFAFMGMLVASCLLGVVVIVLKGAKEALADPMQLVSQPVFLFGSLIATQLSIGLAVWKLPALFKDQDGGPWLARMRWLPEKFSALDLLITLLGTLGVGVLSMGVVRLIGAKGMSLEMLDKAAQQMNPALFGVLMLIGSLGAGFCEEFAFRGMLQTRLVQKFGATAGIFIAAAVFGFWHLDAVHSPLAMMLGLWLGWCAHRQGTIVTVVLAHTLNNAISFIGSRTKMDDSQLDAKVSIAIGFVVFLICAAAMFARTRNRAV
ncbi:MAG: type II CAAX endopeptidase family protein [Archangium sp.]